MNICGERLHATFKALDWNISLTPPPVLSTFCPRMHENAPALVVPQTALPDRLSQDEMLAQTRQVIQGLEALRQEHHSLLEGFLGSLNCLEEGGEKENTDPHHEDRSPAEDKAQGIRRSLETLELGLSEAQVRHFGVRISGRPARALKTPFSVGF